MKIENNVAYWCKTEELTKEFLEKCEKQGYGLTMLARYNNDKEKACYYSYKKYNLNIIDYCTKNCFESLGGKIIEYKGEQKCIKDNLIELVKKGIADNSQLNDDIITLDCNDFDHTCEEIANNIIENMLKFEFSERCFIK